MDNPEVNESEGKSESEAKGSEGLVFSAGFASFIKAFQAWRTRNSESTQCGCFCFSSLRIVLMPVEAASGSWLNSVVSSSSEGLLNEGVRSCAPLVLGECMSQYAVTMPIMTR